MLRLVSAMACRTNSIYCCLTIKVELRQRRGDILWQLSQDVLLLQTEATAANIKCLQQNHGYNAHDKVPISTADTHNDAANDTKKNSELRYCVESIDCGSVMMVCCIMSESVIS